MAIIDRVYKDLGRNEANARRQGDGAVIQSIQRQREALLRHIEAENPQYAAALRAYSEPMSLANAADQGKAAAAKTV